MELIGIINLYNNAQDFVYPVYQKNGEYFFENTENNIIKSFTPIKNVNLFKKITILTESNSVFYGAKKIYYIGDEKPHTFQADKNNIVVCNLTSFIKFLKLFKTQELELRGIINCFIVQNQQSTNFIKK